MPWTSSTTWPTATPTWPGMELEISDKHLSTRCALARCSLHTKTVRNMSYSFFPSSPLSISISFSVPHVHHVFTYLYFRAFCRDLTAPLPLLDGLSAFFSAPSIPVMPNRVDTSPDSLTCSPLLSQTPLIVPFQYQTWHFSNSQTCLPILLKFVRFSSNLRLGFNGVSHQTIFPDLYRILTCTEIIFNWIFFDNIFDTLFILTKEVKIEHIKLKRVRAECERR